MTLPGFPRRRRAAWAVVLAWVSVAFTLSSLPTGPLPHPAQPIPHFDKILHFLLYLAGGAAFANAWHRTLPAAGWLRVLVLSMAMLTAHGVLDEFRQTFVEGRSGNDPGDLAADIAGSLAGAVLITRRLPNHARKRSTPPG